MNLSREAKSALIDGHVYPSEVAQELQDAGLIGERGGMTCKGVVVRKRLIDEALNEAFGR